MKLTELFLTQLEREVDRCRRSVERVPEGRNDWKPHPRSMELGYLATLVATMPSWIAMAIDQDELDLAPREGPAYRPPAWTTNAELLQRLEEAAGAARKALAGTSDEHLLTSWRLLVAEQPVLEDPRYLVIAETLTHLAHHRGQLTVYLRLNEVPVPALYGPSADEQGFG
jgi:hypothetical protein